MSRTAVLLASLLGLVSTPAWPQQPAQPPGSASAAATPAAQAPVLQQQVVVTAARTPLALDSSASSLVDLTFTALQQSPGFTLDDRLRQVAGFQLYRRSSSWAANPTSQGVSLRGLGSTAASRTLVLSDQVPLLDPFLASVHWNEIPTLSAGSVEVMRGGASDLYGSSAIGGVINVVPFLPTENTYALDAFGGGLGTYGLDTLATASTGKLSGLAAGDYFHTDGYIPVPLPYRGTVDADDNVHSQNGRVELREAVSADSNIFVRGNVLNEARQNGTELQSNATRLWRYQTGGDWSNSQWGHALVRVYGSDENYRQSFSSVNAARTTETRTNFQHVPTQELGVAAQWAQTFLKTLTLVAGADVRDIRADDSESPVGKALSSTSGRQRYTGVYGEALWMPKRWSISLSGRYDHFAVFSGIKTTSAGITTLEPTVTQDLFNPRFGVVRELTNRLSLTGSVFRAYRGPTLNELYRTGQVGQTTMLANADLKSERATGFEGGVLANAGHLGHLRSSYFWTEVNDPITNLVIATSGSSITEQRENLGQIRSRGVSLEYEAHPLAWLMLTDGYQYAKATVTQFTPQPSLVGTWTPEVPRNTFSGTVQMQSARWGSLDFYATTSGKEYDATGNAYELSGYARFDISASHRIRGAWQAYAGVQNLLDRSIQVARTPVLSLGTPQVAVFGVRRQASR